MKAFPSGNNSPRRDMHLLCVALGPGLPDDLEEVLQGEVARLCVVQGLAAALREASRRLPDAVLLAAGGHSKGVWLASGVLREFDPDLPCIVLVDEDADLAEVCGMSPGASVLRLPDQLPLLPGHLRLAWEQSRRRRGLQESLQLLRTMCERMPVPVLLVEHGERLLSQANASARELGLYEGGQCPEALLPGVFYRPPWDNPNRAAEGFLHGAGYAGKSWDIYGVWLPNGQFMLTATDVSARVQAKERLHQSEQRLLALVRNSAVGLYVADLEGRIRMANPALASILGYDSPEQLMQEVRSLDAQVYVQQGRHQEMLEALRREEAVLDWVSQAYGRDGDLLWLQQSLAPMYDDAGDLCGCEGSVLDVTQRRYAEQGYQSALAMLRRTFDSMSDVVMLIDLEQRIVLCNTSFAREFGQDKDEVAGAPLGRFLLGSGVGGESRTLKQYLGSDKEYNFLLRNSRIEATYMTSMSPFQDETGAIVGAILIARNVDNITSMVNTVVDVDA